MSITIISAHQSAHKLPKVAESLPLSNPTISDRNALEFLFALGNAKRVIAHGVKAAGRVGFLVHAADDFVDFAGRGDVFCAVCGRAGHCCGAWFCARR